VYVEEAIELDEVFDGSDMDDAAIFDGIKLGGCADPLLVDGSILDDEYIPRKSSKLGRVPTIPFGFKSSEDPVDKKLRFEVGAVSECGIRDSNEDSYLIASDIHLACMGSGLLHGDSLSAGLFAVFDGHCGDHAARFAAEKLMSYIHARSLLHTESANLLDHIEEVLRDSITQLDDEFCALCVSGGREWESGATALVAALVDEQLVIANLGDARGVICRSVEGSKGMKEGGWTELPSEDCRGTSGRVYWKQVTSTHSPARDDERIRIEKANGWITYEKEIPIAQFHRMALFDQDVVDILKRCFSDRIQASSKAAAPQRILQISRVCGELAVSRAIGDRDFKSTHNPAGASDCSTDTQAFEGEWHNTSLFLPYPENHRRSFIGDLVSNIPDFQTFPVGEPGVSDEFLLLGCDGLWDVMDSDDAVRVTRDLLFEKGWSAKRAANRLAELAVHLGSSDNITVIVIRFLGRNRG
jgi:serine/threonine protein phosphatase PrpC